MTLICVGNQTIIGSDNGFAPCRRQAIIWTNVEILLIGPLGTNFSELLIKIHTFSYNKMHWKMLSRKCQPFCLGREWRCSWSIWVINNLMAYGAILYKRFYGMSCSGRNEIWDALVLRTSSRAFALVRTRVLLVRKKVQILVYNSPARPKAILRKEERWLTDVGHNSWRHMKSAQHAAHNPQIRKAGIIQTYPVVAFEW